MTETPYIEVSLLAPGSTFDGKFHIVSKLGDGGFAHLYRATQDGFDRDVALKFVRPDIIDEWESVERFLREARVLATLRHRNIPAIFEYKAVQRKYAYIAMEYCEGSSLRSLLNNNTRMSSEQFLSVFTQICQALQHAHANGIIHRDLSPSNVIVTTDGSVKVIDFGLAKLLAPEGLNIQQLTQTGFLVGTPDYLSPEQCLGEKPVPASDIYSVGCMMYEAATGVKPFEADAAMGLVYKHVHDEAIFLFEENNETGQRFGEIIKACMQKDPAMRIASAAELERLLIHAQQTKEFHPARHITQTPRASGVSRRLVSSSFVIPAVLVAAVVGYFSISPRMNVVPEIELQTSSQKQQALTTLQLYLLQHNAQAAAKQVDQIKRSLKLHPALDADHLFQTRLMMAEATLVCNDGISENGEVARQKAYDYACRYLPNDLIIRLTCAKQLLDTEINLALEKQSPALKQKCIQLANDIENLVSGMPQTLQTALASIEAGEAYIVAQPENPRAYQKDLDAWHLRDPLEQSVFQRHLSILRAHFWKTREQPERARAELLKAMSYPKIDTVTLSNLHELTALTAILGRKDESAKFQQAEAQLWGKLKAQPVADAEGRGGEYAIWIPGH